VTIEHRRVSQSGGLFHSRSRLPWSTTGAFRPFICSLSSHYRPHLSLARSLKGEAAVVNFKTPAEAKAALAAEAAAAEGGAGAEPSGDESDDALDEQPSSDKAAHAEITLPVSKRQRLSASPFPSPPTVPPGAKRSRTGCTSATPPTRATARPRSTTPPPPRLDAQWLDVSLTVDTPALSDEPVFVGAHPALQELFSISKLALEHLASLQRKLQAPPGEIVLELPPELSALHKAITQARSMLRAA